MLRQDDPAHEASELDESTYHEHLSGAANLWATGTVPFGVGDEGDLAVSVAGVDHPDFGRGVELLLVLPVVVGEVPDPESG